MSYHALWLIKRGPRPAHMHQDLVYHPVILCDRRNVALWEAGWSDDHAWVWTRDGWGDDRYLGWLLERWNGLDIDYGHVVRGFPLPDGCLAAFWRDYRHEGMREGCLSELIDQATWWSNRPMPEWLKARGAQYPRDTFTQKHILDEINHNGYAGLGMLIKNPVWERPACWPEPVDTVKNGIPAEWKTNQGE